jgi:hypothetical protein
VICSTHAPCNVGRQGVPSADGARDEGRNVVVLAGHVSCRTRRAPPPLPDRGFCCSLKAVVPRHRVPRGRGRGEARRGTRQWAMSSLFVVVVVVRLGCVSVVAVYSCGGGWPRRTAADRIAGVRGCIAERSVQRSSVQQTLCLCLYMCVEQHPSTTQAQGADADADADAGEPQAGARALCMFKVRPRSRSQSPSWS